ncbi:MAG: hypothetical protein U0790_26015 [Isosphaeraceae bacterium]
MTAVAVIALALVDARLATLVVLAATSAVAIRNLLAGPSGGRSRRWAVPYFVTLGCLYLPFAWVIWGYPWDDYRWHWIKLWPVLPGLVAGMVFHPDDSAVARASGAAAVLLVALLTVLGSRRRAALLVVNGVALIGSGLESCLAYGLYLM